MNLSSDQIVFWEYGLIKINLTLVTTWGIMVILAVIARIVSRKFSRSSRRTRWQNFLEMLVINMQKQISAIGLTRTELYLPFIGTLFLFIAFSALLTIVPGYMPPTGSLSTTTALALCVFIAVPYFGIRDQGLAGYLRGYIKPTVIMLPFNLIGEFSRTLAMAVRLFGNMMSGVMILAVLLTIAPLVIPIIMTGLGLITGMVQAYIFSILTAVYIAAAVKTHEVPTPGRHKAPKR